MQQQWEGNACKPTRNMSGWLSATTKAEGPCMPGPQLPKQPGQPHHSSPAAGFSKGLMTQSCIIRPASLIHMQLVHGTLSTCRIQVCLDAQHLKVPTIALLQRAVCTMTRSSLSLHGQQMAFDSRQKIFLGYNSMHFPINWIRRKSWL